MAERNSLPLEEPGLWVERIGDKAFRRNLPALFLDRDGTVNEDTGYPGDPADVVLRPEIVPIIRTANDVGLPVVIVTNQSGIARGYFDWHAFAAVNGRVIELLRGHRCTVDMVLACAYHEAGVPPYGLGDHPMRKPNPGMLLLAAERLGIDLQRSFIVGDKDTDMSAGQAAGLQLGWLIDAGDETVPKFTINRLSTADDRDALVAEIEQAGRRSA